MGEIISFNNRSFDIEKVFKVLEENNIAIKTIFMMGIITNEPVTLKDGKFIGGDPNICFENPNKEDILNRLQEYIERLEGLNISCCNPKVDLEFNRFSRLIKTTDMSEYFTD